MSLSGNWILWRRWVLSRIFAVTRLGRLRRGRWSLGKHGLLVMERIMFLRDRNHSILKSAHCRILRNPQRKCLPRITPRTRTLYPCSRGMSNLKTSSMLPPSPISPPYSKTEKPVNGMPAAIPLKSHYKSSS